MPRRGKAPIYFPDQIYGTWKMISYIPRDNDTEHARYLVECIRCGQQKKIQNTQFRNNMCQYCYTTRPESKFKGKKAYRVGQVLGGYRITEEPQEKSLGLYKVECVTCGKEKTGRIGAFSKNHHGCIDCYQKIQTQKRSESRKKVFVRSRFFSCQQDSSD